MTIEVNEDVKDILEHFGIDYAHAKGCDTVLVDSGKEFRLIPRKKAVK